MKPVIANIAAVALVAVTPAVASAQSAVHQSLQGDSRYQCTQELQWNARSSTAPVADRAFWYASSLQRAVIAFEQKPSTPGPWMQIQATNCVTGQSKMVWTREW